MTAKAKETTTDEAGRPLPDRHGLILIKNGNTEARILPESFRIWKDKGWELSKEHEPVDVAALTAATATEEKKES